MQDAQVDQSLEWQFAAAYEAARLLCNVVLRAAGYRAPSGPGQHRLTIAALPHLMGSAQNSRAKYYDKCRRRRADIIYEATATATKQEVAELLGDLEGFRAQVEGWLREHHPELMP